MSAYKFKIKNSSRCKSVRKNSKRDYETVEKNNIFAEMLLITSKFHFTEKKLMD